MRTLLIVGNPGPRPVPATDLIDRVGGVPVRVAVPALSAGAETTVEYPLAAPQRGLYTLGPVRAERHDPWQLARRGAPVTKASRLWVHPRTHPTRPLPIGLTIDFDGRLADRSGSTAFSSLREYRPGDDPRAVHWRTTARAGTLIVRDRVDTREPSVHLVVDSRTAAFGREAFEDAAEFAASVCRAYQEANRPVGLSAIGEDLAAVSAAGGFTVMDRLAALNRVTAGITDLTRLVDGVPPGGSLVVLSGEQPDAVEAVAACRRHFWTTVVVGIHPDLAEALHQRHGITVLTAADAPTAARLFTRLTGSS
jgi:uncharacterized protein (DUF58 family)